MSIVKLSVRLESQGHDYYNSGVGVEMWHFVDKTGLIDNWFIKIEKTHPALNGLDIKFEYDENDNKKRCWELEFDSKAGYQPHNNEPKYKIFWAKEHKDDIKIKRIQEHDGQERERERERHEMKRDLSLLEREQKWGTTNSDCWIGGYC